MSSLRILSTLPPHVLPLFGMQVAQLLREIHRLRGDPLPPASADSANGTPLRDSSSGAVDGGLNADQLLTATGVISAHLVAYDTLQELIERNRCVGGWTLCERIL